MSRFDLVLGVETSCDETSAAVVRQGRQVLSNVISSQVEIHRRFGGVVPEIASRKHVECIIPVLQQALDEAGVSLNQLEGIAVTQGPGLVGGLLVGVSAAKAMAYALEVPLVGVNHVEGHICANFLSHAALTPPALCLTVSGGHTDLLLISDYGKYQLLGRTRDDAAGEAFDKVARVLGLGYPGGPPIDSLAADGDPTAFALPRSTPGEYDFSFSGLKTALVNIVHQAKQRGTSLNVPNLAASFQAAVVDVLVARSMAAAEALGIPAILMSGGVAANSGLRHAMCRAAAARGIPVYYPSTLLCTDNAAMVACAGYYRLTAGDRSDLSLNAIPSLRLAAL